MRALVVVLLILGSSSPALATIKYCNNFKYDIHIAIAYETPDGFVSEGWTGVKANSCWEDKDIVSPILLSRGDRRDFYRRREDHLVLGQ